MFDWHAWKATFDTWLLDRFDFDRPWLDRWPPNDQDPQRPEVTPGQSFDVTIQEIDHGHVFGAVDAADDIGVTGYSIASYNPDHDRDGVRAFSIDDAGVLSISDLDDVDFGRTGRLDVAVRAHDADGNTSTRENVSLSLTSDPLTPKDTPFGYNIGINYESWESGRTGYSISADLDQITEDFKLIKTYHAAAVGTSDPTTPIIDPTQAEVITYAVATTDVELVMGTENSALSQLNITTGAWEAGLMTDQAYTDKWVQMLIDAFGSKANVEKHLKAILLGNEIDANGPPPGNAAFNDYLTWINTSFDNLKTSLSDAGLGSIAVSTTIANYGSTNAVSVQATQHINDNWGTDWNDGTPFVLYNQYTQDGMKSTDFTSVEQYFELIQNQVPAGLEVFIGETGYSTTADPSDPTGSAQNQADVYTQIFDWLDGMDGQQGNGGTMVPMFPFVAFDRPSAGGIEVGFGIYGENGTSQPTGLKPDLASVVPDWTDNPIVGQILDDDALMGTENKDIFDVDSGTGTIDGGDGNHDLLVLNGERDEFDFSAVRSKPETWWDFFRKADTVRIESKDDDTTSIDIKNIEYVQFEDTLVRVEDLTDANGLRGWGNWDFFDIA